MKCDTVSSIPFYFFIPIPLMRASKLLSMFIIEALTPIPQ
eukprot:UN03777